MSDFCIMSRTGARKIELVADPSIWGVESFQKIARNSFFRFLLGHTKVKNHKLEPYIIAKLDKIDDFSEFVENFVLPNSTRYSENSQFH